MKTTFIITIMAASVCLFPQISFAQKQSKKQKNKDKKTATFQLATKTDTISYIIGADIYGNLQANSIDINVDAFMQGLLARKNGTDTIFTQEEIMLIINEFQKELQIRQQEKMDRELKENKAKGQQFLSENRQKPDVIETPSGLQYKVIQQGNGVKPNVNSTITVHYEGRLIDGTIFDSSYQRGEPITFELKRMIQGWIEALQLMPEGSIYELYIPSELGYGDRPIPGIPAGSVLIFKVELLKVE